MPNPRSERIDLKSTITTVPDFPHAPVQFRDIMSLLSNPGALIQASEDLAALYEGEEIDYVVGIESRGFILGGLMAAHFKAGFVPMRKPGKLPGTVISRAYELEYATSELQLQKGVIRPGSRVLIHDDIVAKGGTGEASVLLSREVGAEVVGFAAMIDLPELGGGERIRKLGVPVKALMTFEGE